MNEDIYQAPRKPKNSATLEDLNAVKKNLFPEQAGGKRYRKTFKRLKHNNRRKTLKRKYHRRH
jgi:hypothetical protein